MEARISFSDHKGKNENDFEFRFLHTYLLRLTHEAFY